MEKKTMGSFLAALRRANGMTQKELAERLNVSDKSVSRWERDDGAPDLALIREILNIFPQAVRRYPSAAPFLISAPALHWALKYARIFG